MTAREALRLIRRYRPKSPADFKSIGIELHKIGTGAFRHSYQIVGLQLIVKFPRHDSDWHVNKCHTRTEVKRLARLRRFAWLRLYLPRVYYFDSRAGIVVMAFYDDSKPLHGRDANSQRMRGMCVLAQRLIFRLTGMRLTDIFVDNVRYDQKTGNVKLIDLAY